MNIILARIRVIADQFCRELAAAYAQAISGTAPVDTGQLARTVAPDGTAITIQDYWALVAYGHRIYSPKTQRLVIKRIDANGDTIYKMSKPNDYMERAWKSPLVQQVIDKYAGSGVSIPYPFSKVNMDIQNN